MSEVLTVLIITSGFSFISFLYIRHIAKLELLIKAESLHDIKDYEKVTESVSFEQAIPDNLQEVFEGKSADEIRAAFN